MANNSAGEGSARAPLPSYEDLLRGKRITLLTDEAQRLRWVLDGSLTTAITVLQQPYHDPDTTPEPYCTSQGNGDPTWHAVSQAPYTDPKISTVTVSVIEIDEWEEQWRDAHRGHTTPPARSENGDREDNDDDDDDDWDFPSECCGEQRPHPQDMSLVVKASGEFITVHDYVSAVHPWLMRKYDDLMGALTIDEPLSLPAEENLMVTLGGPKNLSVGTKEVWLKNKDKSHYLQFAQRPVYTEHHWDPPAPADSPDGRPPGYTGRWPPTPPPAFGPLSGGQHTWGTGFPSHWRS
ncbi:hypothetical protein CONLIGDRAFT_126421 [Coniochaeta ligniaria NRRL 30616]|uniref:Uncharacterized protein n=1 Tax=Coniochaeta ligniaria NRRL 30616 TaxID=1408157 RepID=A0A1J7I6X8_9PEZI|nr:hypothetical protein CONLIGDRAFT_126421 [Coniochaeta ligniaria NRRL 30616]